MKIELQLFQKRDPLDEAAADDEAEAEIEAGRGIDHAEVGKWLKTWGTPEERPIPPEWLE
jgi:predicted transcriptional regulator